MSSAKAQRASLAFLKIALRDSLRSRRATSDKMDGQPDAKLYYTHDVGMYDLGLPTVILFFAPQKTRATVSEYVVLSIMRLRGSCAFCSRLDGGIDTGSANALIKGRNRQAWVHTRFSAAGVKSKCRY